jgi:hypothetical protein
MREPVGFHAQSEESIVDASAAGVDRIELQLAAKAELRAKAKPTRSGLHLRPALWTSSIASGNDFLAALGATARKDLLAARGFHTGAKTGGAFALDLAGLISAFHGDRSEAADLPEKRAGRLRSWCRGCQYNPVRNG